VMGAQRTFASLARNANGKVTSCERFVTKIDAVTPWPRSLALIERIIPRPGTARQPLGLEKTLRIYSLQE
jgi:transposase, IS5 family